LIHGGNAKGQHHRQVDRQVIGQNSRHDVLNPDFLCGSIHWPLFSKTGKPPYLAKGDTLAFEVVEARLVALSDLSDWGEFSDYVPLLSLKLFEF